MTNGSILENIVSVGMASVAIGFVLFAVMGFVIGKLVELADLLKNR